jgi:LL-diaminopimelate aminotransferase
MLESRLPPGGKNLFQEIKAQRLEAKKLGIQLIDLSIGQPSGPALLSARKAAAIAVMSEEESMHEYQDNGSPGVPDFAKRFVAGHVNVSLDGKDVDYLPISGIKPILGLIVLACGSDLRVVATTTNPGYPTPKVQCGYLNRPVFEPDINPGNKFLFNPKELTADFVPLATDIGLVMMNYPHNPSGAVANKDWLRLLCQHCEANGIRLFNDAAYAAMSYGESLCLADVATDFPDLSWAEAFSASKLLGNGTGWRVGAMVGSPDFMGDIKTIKGNADSGASAFSMAGALHALENDEESIQNVVDLYQRRASLLCRILLEAGMHLALEPRAGFFTLWQAPKRAFGQEMRSANEFNATMIVGDGKVGLIGAPFAPYVRYSVAYTDVEAIASDIKAAFAKAEVSY